MKPLDSMTGRGCCGKSLRFVAAGLVTVAVVRVAHWISSETSSILREESQAQFSLHNLPSKEVTERSKIQTVTRGSLRNSFRQMQEIHVKPAIPHAKILNITSFSGVDQDDPRLVAFVRQRMRSPAPSSQPYNLMHPEKTDFSQSNQSTYADREFLHGMTNGFFVEMGAVDGEIFSNSLYFERTLNWTGLLVEANPEDYHTLTTRGRKAYSIHAAVSPKNTSGMSTFNRRSQLFGRLGPDEGTGVAVWRFPLYTMLAALNVSTVDFLSLDVEGDELEVLRTIPWERITIRIMCVEINHVKEGARRVIEYMLKQDYIFLGIQIIDAWFGKKHLIEETLHSKLHMSQMLYMS